MFDYLNANLYYPFVYILLKLCISFNYIDSADFIPLEYDHEKDAHMSKNGYWYLMII